MIQCVMCEDWLHGRVSLTHLRLVTTPVPHTRTDDSCSQYLSSHLNLDVSLSWFLYLSLYQ